VISTTTEPSKHQVAAKREKSKNKTTHQKIRPTVKTDGHYARSPAEELFYQEMSPVSDPSYAEEDGEGDADADADDDEEGARGGGSFTPSEFDFRPYHRRPQTERDLPLRNPSAVGPGRAGSTAGGAANNNNDNSRSISAHSGRAYIYENRYIYDDSDSTCNSPGSSAALRWHPGDRIVPAATAGAGTSPGAIAGGVGEGATSGSSVCTVPRHSSRPTRTNSNPTAAATTGSVTATTLRKYDVTVDCAASMEPKVSFLSFSVGSVALFLPINAARKVAHVLYCVFSRFTFLQFNVNCATFLFTGVDGFPCEPTALLLGTGKILLTSLKV
jgi:hypothetical protein